MTRARVATTGGSLIRKQLRLLLAFAFLSHAQTPAIAPADAVIRVKVELVVVDAQVVRKKTGRTVGLLKQSDFELSEDGAKQNIVFFSQDQLPLSIVLLFDLTDSVRPVLKPLANGALNALAHLKPEDETAVMVYAASAELLQDFTTDRGRTVAAIQRASEMTSNEPAFFNEGVLQAAAQLTRATNPGSRRVIIWLTDNVPNLPIESKRGPGGQGLPESSLHTESDAFRQLFETGAVVSSLVERSAISNTMTVLYSRNPLLGLARKHYPPGDVFKYAEATGGQVMKSSAEDVSTKLAELIDQIRTRYSLGYRPSVEQAPGKFCSILLKISPEVEAREGKLAVRAKRGYYRLGAP